MIDLKEQKNKFNVVFVCHLPPSMSVYCWLSWRCPQPPGTLRGGLALMQGEQSWTRCCIRASLLHTCLPHNIYHPPGKGEKLSNIKVATGNGTASTKPSYGSRCDALWPYSYLLYVSIVGPTDKLFQLRKTVCFSQGKDQLRLHVGLSRFLSGHLEEFNQVFPVVCRTQTTALKKELGPIAHEASGWRSAEGSFAVEGRLTVLAGRVHHLHVSWRVYSFNVRVDCLLDQVSVQLSSS